MADPEYQCRRASSDDLPRLFALWRETAMSADELEKRFTEFQLIEDRAGGIVGAIGLRILSMQGHLHDETYADFALVDTLRPLLWQRIKNVAGSHGLLRLWTTETAPFWRHEDFAAADDEMLAKLPGDFGPREGRWLTLKLRDELALDDFLTNEIAAFKQSEREHNERLLGRARFLKGMATLLAVAALALVAYAIYTMFKSNPLPR